MTRVKSRNGPAQSTYMFGGIDEKRLERIWTQFWINYPEGTRALEHLEWVLKQPKSFRTQCSLIIADPAAGKTSIAKQFAKTVNPTPKLTDKERHLPVVYVQSPPNGNAAALYTNILREIGAPYQPTWQVARKQDQVLHMLTKLKTRMLIVDELHAMLAGNVNERNVFMWTLKHLSSELQIPIVGIGTKEALRAMQTDEQFANRFEPYRLKKWEVDDDYVHFLIQICRHAGFKKTAVVKRKDFVRRVHTLAKGLTGETWKLMSKLIEYAEIKCAGQLTMDTLDKIKWVTPGERRWAASRKISQEIKNGPNAQRSHGELAGRTQKKDRGAKQGADAKPRQRNDRKSDRSDKSRRRSATS